MNESSDKENKTVEVEPLFAQLGFSRELYDIRQKNSKFLLASAWVLEVIAASIGLFIAYLITRDGLDAGIDPGNALIGALPFLMVAVVELMKIPIVTIVYHTKNLFWKIKKKIWQL